MAVFRSGPRAGVVVDVGPEPGLARRCLDDLDVDRVDAVLLTHLHADHAGDWPAWSTAPPPGRCTTRPGTHRHRAGEGAAARRTASTARRRGTAPHRRDGHGRAGAVARAARRRAGPRGETTPPPRCWSPSRARPVRSRR
ncbi:MBL fold metallo-hydrolase [Micrococcus luteus]|uniref:MBL fold metallo-hydrolase n=1 Tax=Micrococcus luteus TaxID=1270 RepID=UPI00211C00A0|nr:MBL fold metallo-hydrolase [Micrococcus luteus]